MYGYAEYVPLTEHEILQRATQEQIVALVMGYEPVAYLPVNSPLRPHDKVPGAYFEYWNGKLFFIDFADKRQTHRVCFKLVADYYNLTYWDALRYINQELSLGLGESSDIAPKPVVNDVDVNSKTTKQQTVIFYKPRPLQIFDKGVWAKFQITKDQLINDGVCGVIWYKFYSHRLQEWITVRKNKERMYAFTEFTNENKVKIYMPDSREKGKRFITNCTENNIFGYKLLPEGGKQVVIQKSYKDWRVLTNQGVTCCALQSEVQMPTEEYLIDLCERFDEIVIFFDNDHAGIEDAIRAVIIINTLYPNKARYVHLPVELYRNNNVTDPSDLVAFDGNTTRLHEFLKSNGIYFVNNR